MKKIFKLIILHFLLCNVFITCYAQESEISTSLSEYMEELLNDESSKFDYEELFDQISDSSMVKINLNTAKVNDLLQIPFLSEIDIHNIVNHRLKYGDFQTLYELKNIPNFNQDKINHLLPFVTISDGEKQHFQWKEELQNGQYILYSQYQQGLQQKKGYIPDSLGTTKYAGPANRYYLKYQFKTPEKIMAGCLMEKDAGEAVWSKYSKLFDFYSFYVQCNDIKKFKQINIGDYKANFGQGLVIGTSTIFGKSSNTMNTFQQREGLYKYSSSNECNNLRGIGATMNVRNTELSLFISHKKKDANLNGEKIKSFKTDGLHRTESEIEKKRNCRESIIGGNASYKNKNIQLGITLLFYHYSDTLLPDDKMYNYYKLKETKQHGNIGLNYKYFFRRMSLFGETAVDVKGGLATLNGLCVQPNSRIGFLALQRYYQPEYQANYSNAFGENSRTENESGLYIGTQIIPMKKFSLNIYADVFRFPWPKYGINYPSKGEDYLAHIQYNTCKFINMQLKFKYKNYIDQQYCKNSLRYINHCKIHSIETQTLAEINKVNKEESKSYGWVISEDLSHEWKKIQLTVNLHYAYFNATQYNNRFYIYERDILNTFSMPLLYGEGHRLGLNFRWVVNHHTQIYLNYSSYFYTDGRENCGSGNEQIEGNISSQIKGLVRWNW